MPGKDHPNLLQIDSLYVDHQKWLQNWLLSRFGSRQDAEDLTQDTFLQILRNRPQLERLRSPRGYLLTVARNLSIDLFRRRTLERQYLEALALLPEADWPGEEQRLLAMETLQLLDRMLEKLGSRVKQTFILSQFDGLTHSQIAEHLGVSRRMVDHYMAKAVEHCCLFCLEHGL